MNIDTSNEAYLKLFMVINRILSLLNLRKATASFVMSVRPSVRMGQLSSHWTDFREIWHLWIFKKICRENSSLIRVY